MDGYQSQSEQSHKTHKIKVAGHAALVKEKEENPQKVHDNRSCRG